MKRAMRYHCSHLHKYLSKLKSERNAGGEY